MGLPDRASLNWLLVIGSGQRGIRLASPSSRGGLMPLDGAGGDSAAVAQISLVAGATDPSRTVTSTGPPSRSSSRTTVIFAAIVASMPAIGYPHGTDYLSCRDQLSAPAAHVC